MQIYKRGKTWTYDIQWVDSKGKAQRLRKGGFKSSKEARAEGLDIEHSVKNGNYSLAQDKSLYEFFEKYIDTYKVDLAPATLQKYYDTLKSIDEVFPYDTIQKLRPDDYQKGLNKYAETHAVATTRKFHTHIKAAIKRGVYNGDLKKDFTEYAVISGNKKAKKDSEKFISESDCNKLLAYIKTKLDPRYPNPYLIYTTAVTGMRFGEVLGLTWKDINFERKTIDINKAWDYKRTHKFTDNKNMYSPRILAISDELADILKIYRDEQKKLLEAKSLANPLDLMFFGASNGLPTNDGANERLKEYLKKLDIHPLISMHGLRHTHASILFRHGVSVLAISKRLGHKNTNVTYSTYLHVIRELENDDQDKILDVLNSSTVTN